MAGRRFKIEPKRAPAKPACGGCDAAAHPRPPLKTDLDSVLSAWLLSNRTPSTLWVRPGRCRRGQEGPSVPIRCRPAKSGPSVRNPAPSLFDWRNTTALTGRRPAASEGIMNFRRDPPKPSPPSPGSLRAGDTDDDRAIGLNLGALGPEVGDVAGITLHADRGRGESCGELIQCSGFIDWKSSTESSAALPQNPRRARPITRGQKAGRAWPGKCRRCGPRTRCPPHREGSAPIQSVNCLERKRPVSYSRFRCCGTLGNLSTPPWSASLAIHPGPELKPPSPRRCRSSALAGNLLWRQRASAGFRRGLGPSNLDGANDEAVAPTAKRRHPCRG